MQTDKFLIRHIGPNQKEQQAMLSELGLNNIDELIDKTIPSDIRRKTPMNLPKPMSEQQFTAHLLDLESQNKLFKTYIGMGYHPTILPAVIQRNILENPGWYTAYTPYQAEIAQGRLEALLNYQTMISDLTGMPITNASLLDEGTAAAEAMAMLFNKRSRDQKKNNICKFFVSKDVFPQTLAVLETRASSIGVELVINDIKTDTLDESYFGVLLQYPAKYGEINDYRSLVTTLHDKNIKVVVAADLMALTLLTPPGEWGADIVVGSTQRFGIPMGYGGPHAGYFSTLETYKRDIPGRIIGVTQDTDGKPALRMALQTREQHIKRDKATSNICTAQVLLAVMAGMYGVYHGPDGLKYIANNIHSLTSKFKKGLEELSIEILTKHYFDTISFKVSDAKTLEKLALEQEVNLWYADNNIVSVSINEVTTENDICQLLKIIASSEGKTFNGLVENIDKNFDIQSDLIRKSDFMTDKIFHLYHSETEMMRYIKKLENRDLALNRSMISLGSCTMKLNSATSMIPISWTKFGGLHPFAPKEQAKGFHKAIKGLEDALSEITGFAATSLQPNSGAQGEFAGLMVIKAYQKHHGEGHRDIVLIPASAHGTNPASAVMAGNKVVVIKTTEQGEIDINDLKEKAKLHKDNLSALMVTYPSTHGVYEFGIKEVTKTIHDNGGLVYMDGANMNAQVGLTNPGIIGADVCHLNLHKTFAIPHGGGGPGIGSISCTEALAPFLPSNPIIKIGDDRAIKAISSAPYGSALVSLIPYAYIKMLGNEGLTESTKVAILNANYLLKKLSAHYPILYKGENNTVAHEMIVDFRDFKKKGVEVTDIAKRLMDYGYHAPTVSFPVGGTLMVEPTESESKIELDRFIAALSQIKKEIDSTDIHDEQSILKNAPHTQGMVIADEWNHTYTRKEAAFPLDYIIENKFWPYVRRVDDAYGDRNLMCRCPSPEAYEN